MENRYFQWVAGDKKGQVVVFDKIETDDENVYIVFKDRSRINESLVAQLNQKDLTGKFMAEIDHPNNTWSFKEEWVGRQEEVWEKNAAGDPVCVVPFIQGRKVIHLVPPKPTPPKSSNFGNISNKPEPKPIEVEDNLPNLSTTSVTSIIDKTDPVYILMSKAKKIDNEITMCMSVALPPKSLYDIAKQSFDEGDEKFINYIVDEITVDEIKDALKTAIKEMYEEEN